MRVSGTLIGPNGPSAFGTLHLFQAGDGHSGDPALEVARSLSDAAGAFTFVGVPAGSYVLRALREPAAGRPAMLGLPAPIPTEPTLWAEEPVTVADQDVVLSATLRVGLRISGRFEFEGHATRPSPERLQQIPVMVESIDALATAITGRGHGDAAGSFTTYGLPAGRYFLRIGGAPAGWTFKGATADGQDIADTPFDLRTSDLTDVVVVFTDQPSRLAGRVTDRQGRPDVTAAVLIFPTDPTTWVDFGLNVRRLRSVQSDAAGAYSVDGLPDSQYFVVAVPDELTESWRDPTLLERLSRTASRVQVEAGARLIQDLRIVESIR